MEVGTIIGNNLKEYRKLKGLSQDQVGAFIGFDRSLISLYENAEREIPITHLEKLSDLFGVDLEDLLEENPEERKANFAFAFRTNGIDDADLQSIASFQKVVKNYLRMKSISNENK